jgi:hypothetical protein
MPDKNYGRCGRRSKRCMRCWRNKLKHGNKLKKGQGGPLRKTMKAILEDPYLSIRDKKYEAKRADLWRTRLDPKYIILPWKVLVKETFPQHKQTGQFQTPEKRYSFRLDN